MYTERWVVKAQRICLLTCHQR